jgi:hypothetical protein
MWKTCGEIASKVYKYSLEIGKECRIFVGDIMSTDHLKIGDEIWSGETVVTTLRICGVHNYILL